MMVLTPILCLPPSPRSYFTHTYACTHKQWLYLNSALVLTYTHTQTHTHTHTHTVTHTHTHTQHTHTHTHTTHSYTYHHTPISATNTFLRKFYIIILNTAIMYMYTWATHVIVLHKTYFSPLLPLEKNVISVFIERPISCKDPVLSSTMNAKFFSQQHSHAIDLPVF